MASAGEIDGYIAETSAESQTADVIPFPKAKADKSSDSCPPDDRCERAQKLLLGRRLTLTNMLAARTVSVTDYVAKATALNEEIEVHNMRCPENKVKPLPIGPIGVR